MLDVRRFKAKQEGPAICFLSGIYGDEVCGTIAINRLISDIENKTINLVRGEIYLISRVNQKAYAEKKHFCDVDLNRVCKKNRDYILHEEMLAEELMRVIDRCDIVVDFQSSNYHDIAFINQFIANSDTSLLSSAIPIANVILGLNKLHGNIKDSSIIDYAYNKSAVAVSVNCGNNKNPNSVEVAYKSMLSVLRACYLAVFSDNIYSHYIEEESPSKKYIKVDSLVRKAKGGRFVKDWIHGEVLLSKQEIAKDAAGVIYKTDKECVICLPNENAEDGGEWYYLGSYLKSLGEIIAGKNLKRSYFMSNINRLSDNTLEKHLQN